MSQVQRVDLMLYSADCHNFVLSCLGVFVIALNIVWGWYNVTRIRGVTDTLTCETDNTSNRAPGSRRIFLLSTPIIVEVVTAYRCQTLTVLVLACRDLYRSKHSVVELESSSRINAERDVDMCPTSETCRITTHHCLAIMNPFIGYTT